MNNKKRSQPNLDLQQGESSLIFGSNTVLKGSFAIMVILTEQLTKDIKDNPTRINDLINDFVYNISHIVTKEGDCFDLIEELHNSKLFTYFPIHSWLIENQLIGRQIIALRFIQYFIHEDDFHEISDVTKLKSQLENRSKHCEGLLSQHNSLALSVLSGNKIDKKLNGKPLYRNNPLGALELQKKQPVLNIDGVAVAKGSVGLFLKSLSALSSHVIENNARNEAVKQVEQVAPHLEKLGFFRFFNKPEDWANILKLIGDTKLDWLIHLPKKTHKETNIKNTVD